MSFETTSRSRVAYFLCLLRVTGNWSAGWRF